ncbi:copper amine oxidase N-terminal domain-containing protein [Brevibacillus ginsengisoli]|uniref:copper amine oxidase N-terminal domain-containing protein n=1 Tax=Brevibacillus ginsengisoli TaxID=363854 RepID=UPI003CF5289E
MKITSKILSAALLTAMTVSSSVSVYAATAPVNPNVHVQPISSAVSYQLIINGTPLASENTPVYVNKQGVIMIPLRPLAEQLGYQIKWNQEKRSAELTKGAQWTAVTPGKDQYNFAKMYLTLGTAPESRQGNTYVPLSFAKQVLKAQVSTDQKGTIKIDDPLQAISQKGTISKVTLASRGDKVKGSILVNGNADGVVLTISSDTVIVNQENKPLSINDLKLGTSVEFVHDPIMTMSLPPITNAKKIIVNDKDVAPVVLGTAGEVMDITKLEDGKAKVLIKGQKLSDNSLEEIALIINKDTPIIDARTQQAVTTDALKKGSIVYGFYGPATTRSLPPIGQAIKLVVEHADQVVAPR